MKNFTKLFVVLLMLMFVFGCESPRRDHYRPERYKYDLSIQGANTILQDVKRDMIRLGDTTPADVVLTTYRESQTTLKAKIKVLKEERENVKKEDKLDRREKKSLDRNYEVAIENLETELKKIEKLEEKFFKMD